MYSGVWVPSRVVPSFRFLEGRDETTIPFSPGLSHEHLDIGKISANSFPKTKPNLGIQNWLFTAVDGSKSQSSLLFSTTYHQVLVYPIRLKVNLIFCPQYFDPLGIGCCRIDIRSHCYVLRDACGTEGNISTEICRNRGDFANNRKYQ